MINSKDSREFSWIIILMAEALIRGQREQGIVIQSEEAAIASRIGVRHANTARNVEVTEMPTD